MTETRKTHPPELRIHLLGPLEVLAGDDPLELPPSRKARALLVYLVATGRPHARSALCDLFWQEANDPRAGLRWALSKLRTVVERGERRIITSDRDRVGVEVRAVDVDLHRVESMVSGDPAAAPTRRLREAAGVFRGEFVDGLDVPGCHQYEAWCMGTRERLRSFRLSIHATLADRLRGDPEAALPHAFARLALDPFSEEAHVAAMELLADVGRVEKGLELYDRCREMLSKELGVPPSEELEAARRRLSSVPRPAPPTKRGRRADDRGMDDLGRALAALPAPEHLPEPGEGDPPLVDRTNVLDALAGIVERSVSEDAGAAILVTGEAGIGKTRLLRELVRRVRASGGWALSGRVFETEEVRPYGPWADLLRRVPQAALDPDMRRGLFGLLESPGPEPWRGAPTERAQLFDAAAYLLQRLADARGPALVVLDDVQWLDPSSAALLHYLARMLADTPLVFALAAREEEIPPGSATARMLRSLDRAGRLHRTPLQRLDAVGTEALVRAVDRELDPGPVFATSEGNPWFTLALAASLREGIHRIPDSIEEELRDRLERFEPGARSLLPWAAALGRTFHVPTLVRVVERPAHEIVEAIHELEVRGVLQATGTDRYDFTHSLLRQAAYRHPSEPVRRQIHRSIATTLHAMDRDRTPGAVAHHAERGGLPEIAASAYAEAAEGCLWIFAFDEAADMVERGLAQVEQLSGEMRTRLEMALLRLYGFRSMGDLRPEDIEDRVRRVTEEARRQGLPQVVAQGHAALMELQYQRGAFDEAGRSSLLSAEAGREGEPTTAIRALAETAACLLILDQAPDDARRLASEAFRLAGEHEAEEDVVPLAAALLHHRDGELEAASHAFLDVVRLARRQRDRWWELPAMTRMAMVELDRGVPERARARALEGEELAERMGDEVEEAFARGLAAVAGEMARVEPGPARSGAGGVEAVEAALGKLRDLDSLWKIAHLQAYAAEVDLERGRVDAARTRAAEMLEAARALNRPSLLALARALLAHCAAVEGDRDAARGHLHSPEITHPEHRVSFRARRAIERARETARSAAPG